MVLFFDSFSNLFPLLFSWIDTGRIVRTRVQEDYGLIGRSLFVLEPERSPSACKFWLPTLISEIMPSKSSPTVFLS